MPKNLEAKFESFRRNFLEDWMEGFKADWPGLIVSAPAGIGKTSFALRVGEHVGRKWVKQNPKTEQPVLFETVQDMIGNVRATWGNPGMRETDVIAAYVGKKLLILDDVGVQFGSQAERNLIYWVIGGRVNRGRPTIITTNIDLNSGEGEQEFVDCAGARILSRFSGFVIDATPWGENLRLKRAPNLGV